MRVLFVSRWNKVHGIAPFVKSQGESLKVQGVDVEYFSVKGKGLSGYLKSIFDLKRRLGRGYDLIHAHYALCGWVSVFAAFRLPILVSFMGCDVYGDVDFNGQKKPGSYVNIFLAALLQPFVKKIIAKSKNLADYVYFKAKLETIPNGVDFNVFKPMNGFYCRDKLGLSADKKLILFIGNPENPRKNIALLKNAVQLLDDDKIQIIRPYPVSHDQVVLYLNAADVLGFCSYLEGSPNVIKEAMACNLPIVATDVGDVKDNIGNTKGCFIASFDPNNVAEKIKKALDFGKRTDGRKKIKHLDVRIIAAKIQKIYNSVLNE